MDRKQGKKDTLDAEGRRDPSRRDFLEGAGSALVVVGARPGLLASEDRGVAGAATPHAEQQIPAVPTTPIALTVNGATHRIEAQDRWTLNELLRDHLGLKGSKIGCNRGECGACTVLLDGEPVYSCSTLAVWADGCEVVTVEGLETDGALTPLQRSFIEHNAAQCGFCTPGQLMVATAFLQKNSSPAAAEVRAALAGNLCRCSNYNAIVEAVLGAADSATGGAP